MTELHDNRDMFLTLAAHEIKTPLTIMIGFAQLLAAQNNQNWTDRERAYLSVILKHAFVLSHISTAILDADAIRGGALAMRRESVELSELLHDMIDLVATISADYEHSFILDRPRGPLFLHADRTHLEMAFFQILMNATVYSDKDTSINITIARLDTGVHIVIENTGPRIDANDLPHVFDRYYRGAIHRAHKTTGISGMGIGLTVAKATIEAHDGTIAITSEERTRVSIFLPTLPTTENRTAVSAHPQPYDNL